MVSMLVGNQQNTRRRAQMLKGTFLDYYMTCQYQGYAFCSKNSQKMNESLRAKIQNLLTLKPFAETKEVYVSEQRIAKMRTNYSLRPVVTWELAQNEDDFVKVQEGKSIIKEETLH